MKLFAVRDDSKIISDFFPNKKDAKKHRDSIGNAYVTKGTDHWLYQAKPKLHQAKKRKNRRN